MNKGPNCHLERSKGSAFLFVAEQHPVRLSLFKSGEPRWDTHFSGPRLRSAPGLRATGKGEELPEFIVTRAALPTGWYAILFNRAEIKDKTLEKLSGQMRSLAVSSRIA